MLAPRLASLLLILPACASVSEPRVRIDRTPLRTEEVVLRTPGRVYVQRALWEKDTLQATIRQERFCQDVERRTARLQRVEERTSRHVGLDIALGALMLAGGGALLGVTPLIPDQALLPAGDGRLTSRALSVTAGVALSGVGISLFAYGIAIGRKARDRPVGDPWVSEEDRPVGPRRPCGTTPPPAGALRLALGEVEVPEAGRPQQGDTVSLDLAPLRPALCRDRAHLGTPLAVSYVPASGPALELASRDLDACIRAEVERASRRDLAGTVDEALRHVQQGDLEAALRPAARALALSRNVPGQAGPVLAQIYGAVVQAALASDAGLVLARRLLAEDEPTCACLEGRDCPEGMERDAVAAALRPFGERLVAELQRGRAALDGAAAQLRRRGGEAGIPAAGKSLEAAEGQLRAFCSRPLLTEVKAACTALGGAAQAAREAQAEVEARLQQRRAARTVTRWQRHFAQCRKVNAAIQQFRAVSSCGARCMEALRRVRADREALEEVQIEGELEDHVRERLQEECERAGCPNCP
jgi:hypothetical protein